MKANTVLVTAAAVAAVATLAVATETEAATSTTLGYVKAESLNVRSGPGTTYSTLGSLSYGTLVQITGQSGSWYQIQYTGQQAYVHSNYISSTAVSTTSNTYTVTASALNVRSAANTESSIIAVLPKGQAVTVQSEQNGWYAISISGKTGYIKKDYVSTSSNSSTVASSSTAATSSYYVTSSSLRVRSGPGTSYDIVGSLNNGDQVQVVGTSGSWYQIRYSGNVAYVSKEYVSTSKSTTSTTQTTVSFKYPSAGTVTSTFGMRWGSMHYGIDIATSGTVKVNAVAAGTVTKSYYSTSYGNVVFIKHKISGQTYTTVYAHLKNRAVQVGAIVSQGQFVGYMGNTGQSTGQHLHFELHKGEWNYQKTNAVDPLLYLKS